MSRRRRMSFGFAAVVALVHAHFPLFRKSRRKTFSVLVVGLQPRGRVGPAEIARGKFNRARFPRSGMSHE